MTPSIQLIVQYCNHPLPARQREYDFCLRRNLANPQIFQVHNLVESRTVVPQEFRTHPNYVEHALGRWMTYQDAFTYANERLAGQVACIANLDIFLDDTGSTDWAAASAMIAKGIVLCLSRVEVDDNGAAYHDEGLQRLAFANSQDAWIFKAPFVVRECDFEIGTLGCDNAIADRIRRSGRLPVNAASRYRIFHYDRCRGKSFANQAEVHRAERAGRPQKHPEEQGQYLLPDIDQIKSVDELLKSLGVSEMAKYVVICDTVSRFIKLNNR